MDGLQISDEIHKSTSRMLLTHANAEYADMCDNWRSIESKAQGTISTSGIFIGGAFVLLKSLGSMPCWALVVSVLVIVVLVAAVICALGALFVRECASLEDTSELLQKSEKVTLSETEDGARSEIRRFVSELVKNTAEANKDVAEANRTKGDWLLAAQVCVVVAIVLASIIIVAGVMFGWY